MASDFLSVYGTAERQAALEARARETFEICAKRRVPILIPSLAA
jgi:hypothetical protein